MGIAKSKDCGCFTAVSKVAMSLWRTPMEEPHLSILDEEEDITPANLLSEHEIQCLLSEGQRSNGHKYETM